jgi:predicted nuclease with TOPRIM domain
LKIRLETYTDDPSDLQKEVIKLRAELNAHRKDQKRHLSESQYLTAQYNNARREVERLTREKEAIEIRTRKLRAYLLKNNPEFDDDGRIFSDDLTTESGESNGPDTPPSIRRSSLLDEQKSHGKRVSSTSSSGSSSSFFVSASVT